MATKTPAQAVNIWSMVQLKENTRVQSHFNDGQALYREGYEGRQRNLRLWSGAPYGDILSLEQSESHYPIHACKPPGGEKSINEQARHMARLFVFDDGAVISL